MNDGREKFEQKLVALRAAFSDKLDIRLAEIEAAVRSLGENGGGDALPALRRLRDLTHKLSGAGGTFGFADLGETAGGIEVFCESVLDRGDGPIGNDIEKIEALVERLKTAAAPTGG